MYQLGLPPANLLNGSLNIAEDNEKQVDYFIWIYSLYGYFHENGVRGVMMVKIFYSLVTSD